MATGGLYGSSPTGAVVAAPGSESAGLYGNGTTFGGSYFEWFIFIQAETQPATPTGGSWSFSTNTGTPPTGWSSVPPSAPTLPVWVSIALVNSKNTTALTWSAPGVFSYSSGLPILSGTSSPGAGDGLTGQLWIETGTTPETIWFKQAGTWTRLTGSSLYVDLTTSQTIAGTKTFSSQIQGSVSGTSSNVTGIVGITNGGTGSSTSSGARTALGLGTAATQDSTAFATAAQGTKADTAIQTITSTDGSVTIGTTGTTRDLSVAVAAATNNVICQVRNTTGATLTKGTVVYISGATGQLPTVSKALATSDATSAQTLGMMSADLANNTNGNVTVIGLITNIDTSAYTDGAQLYLSGTTAGTVTATKPYAPIHLVYVAVVEHSHPTQGKLFVKVQNGYELDEIHNVSAQTPSNGQTIVWNSATSLWQNNTVSLSIGVNGTLPIANGGTGQTTAASAITALTGTQTNAYYLRSNGTNATLSALSAADLTGTVSIATGGTGQTTANAAFNALAPSQTGNSGKYLTTDGSNTSWATNPLGTVTSVGGTGTVSGISLSGTVTTSGNLTLGGALDLSAYNGAGAFTTLSASSTVTLSGGTANGVTYLNGSKVLTSGSALTFDGTNLGVGIASTSLTSSFTGQQIHNANASQGTQLRLTNAGTGSTSTDGLALSIDATGLGYLWNSETSGISFGSSGSEQMRLTSTGLGIGTSSPTSRLYVGASSGKNTTTINGGSTNSGDGAELIIANSGTTYGGMGNYSAVFGGAYDNTMAVHGYWGMRFFTLAAERMRIDSSGNVGIGTSSPLTKLNPQADITNSDLGQLVISGNTNSNKRLSLGFQTTGNYGFVQSLIAGDNYYSLALQPNGGNVGIGTSSPSVNLDVVNASALTRVYSTTITNPAYTQYRVGSNISYVGSDRSDGAIFGGSYALALWNSGAYSVIFGTNNAEKARIDSSGNLLVGTTSNVDSNLKIQLVADATNTQRFFGVNNGGGYGLIMGFLYNDQANIRTVAAYPLVLGTNNTERARIDSSGNWLVGKTATGISTVGFAAKDYIEVVRDGNPVGYFNRLTSDGDVIQIYSRSTKVGSISVTSTATAYNTSSDYRLKNVTGPITNSGAYIDSLNPVEGTWKADGSTFVGLIAHEIQESSRTQVATGTKDGEEMQAMDYSSPEIIANLIAEIQSLRKRLADAGIA